MWRTALLPCKVRFLFFSLKRVIYPPAPKPISLLQILFFLQCVRTHDQLETAAKTSSPSLSSLALQKTLLRSVYFQFLRRLVHFFYGLSGLSFEFQQYTPCADRVFFLLLRSHLIRRESGLFPRPPHLSSRKTGYYKISSRMYEKLLTGVFSLFGPLSPRLSMQCGDLLKV